MSSVEWFMGTIKNFHSLQSLLGKTSDYVRALAGEHIEGSLVRWLQYGEDGVGQENYSQLHSFSLKCEHSFLFLHQDYLVQENLLWFTNLQHGYTILYYLICNMLIIIPVTGLNNFDSGITPYINGSCLSQLPKL